MAAERPPLTTWLGVVAKDWLRYRRLLSGEREAYLALCNRYERLEAAPEGRGFACGWQWTSDLHAPKVIPSLGKNLMRKCLQAHPIRLEPAVAESCKGSPRVSFVIGHRGLARLPHLLMTLQSIAGQTGAEVDCVVVEQDTHQRIRPHLPDWVTHVFSETPDPQLPYCRSWAFNIGVQHARSATLVLHDNDMLVPTDYAAGVVAKMQQGFEVVNPKRFIFYLQQDHTEAIFAGGGDLYSTAPQAIVQNLEGGGSVAITRAAFDDIGGMDESFIGWGGEDNEFWERAGSLRVWKWSWLPLVHLWHAAQPGKRDPNNPTAVRLAALSQTAPALRIQRLRSMPKGLMEGPSALAMEAFADQGR